MGFDRTGNARGKKPSIKGRKLYVPQMSHGGAVAFAAAFRSVGIEAQVCPDSDARHAVRKAGHATDRNVEG